MSTVAATTLARAGPNVELDVAAPAAGVDGEVPPSAEALAGRDPGEAAHAVAAHLGDAAVGVVEQHRGVGAVGAGPDHDQPVGADAAVTVAERGGLRRDDAGHAGVLVQPRPDEEVVPGGVQLRQPDGAHRAPALPGARGGSSTDSRRRPNHVMRGSRRNHMRWRRAKLPGADDRGARARRRATGSRRRGGRAPPGSRSPAGRCATARRRRGEAADLVDQAGVAHRARTARSMRSSSTGARQPHAGDADREHRGAELLEAGTERRERSPGDLDHLERARDPAARCRARCAPRRRDRRAASSAYAAARPSGVAARLERASRTGAVLAAGR